MKVDQDAVRWFRLRRSGLVDPFPSPVHAAQALVGVQAQMLPAAGLALFNRCPGLTDAGFGDLLHGTRSLVRTWGQRTTLHVYARDDWSLIIGLLSQRLAEHESAPCPFGMPQAIYRDAIAHAERLLKGSESLGRKGLSASGLELGERCFSPWGGIFADLAYRGLACHVRREEGEGRFAHRHNWLPDLEWSPPSYEEACARLVKRYARTYGPVSERDLAWWLGARITDARRWLDELGDELVPVDGPDGTALLRKEDATVLQERPPPTRRWPLIMLYRFDPLLVGFRDREWVVREEHHDLVSRPAGHIEGVVLGPLDGMACATWKYAREGGGITVSVSPFRPLEPEVKRGIKVRSKALAAYFGLSLNGVRFARALG